MEEQKFEKLNRNSQLVFESIRELQGQYSNAELAQKIFDNVPRAHLEIIMAHLAAAVAEYVSPLACVDETMEDMEDMMDEFDLHNEFIIELNTISSH